jgi:N-acetylglutamate synthase-like GNAT family acetyltransferase
MTSAASPSNRGARTLCAKDAQRVAAIDRAHTGHLRNSFFEKRFAAAEANPNDFVHIGVVRGGSLRGFILAHLERGEFGRDDIIGVFDAVGVEPEVQERGVGQDLFEELIAVMRQKGVRKLYSEANWTNHSLMRFLDASGFVISPRLVLERPVAEVLAENSEEV